MPSIAGIIVLVFSLALVATFLFCACVRKKPTGEEEKKRELSPLTELKLTEWEEVDPR